MKTKAIVFPAKDQIEVREVTLPAVGPDDIRTETIYSFVSPGTELRVLAGHYGSANKFPFVPGYSWLGRVVEVGSSVKRVRVGDLLTCRDYCLFEGLKSVWGGEAGMHVGKPEELVILPEEAAADPLPYAVAEVASISYRGVTSANPQPGEQAVVIGQGMIGSFVAEFLRMRGCIVTVCDISAERLAEAKAAGFRCVTLDEEAPEERLLAFGDKGFDLVAECSGSTPGFKLATKLLRQSPYDKMRRQMKSWPRLLLQANYVEEIPLNPCWFFGGEGVILLTPSDRSQDDRQQVVELIRRGELPVRRFLKNIFTPEEMPEAYRKLQRREISSVVCRWGK